MTSTLMAPLLPGVSCHLAESPIWDDRHNALYWVDIEAGILHRFLHHTCTSAFWEFDEKISCIGLTEGVDLLVAGTSGIWRFNPFSSKRTLWARFPRSILGMRPNDGKIGPDGAFWVSTMEDLHHRGPRGCLYRFTSDGNVACMLSGLVTPNGLEWSLDNKTLYLAETREGRITQWSFDLQSGTIHSPAPFVQLDSSMGKPDGACLDAYGNYWVCAIYSGNILCFNRQGILIGKISTGYDMITMPCLGGPEFRTLYVTSLSKENDRMGPIYFGTSSSLKGMPPRRMHLI